MNSFYTDVLKRSSWFGSACRLADPGLLEPVTRRKVLAILADVRGHGQACVLFETYRSKERQQQLFRAGATHLEHVGVHHYGLAADIVLLDKHGQPTWDDNLPGWEIVGRSARAHGLIWGGDWRHFTDLPHVQRCPMERQPQLFAGAWYPE